MPNRIEELFAELAESAGGQQQFQIDQQLRQQEAERELYDTDEARRALEIAGILGLVALPIPGSNTLAARLGLGQAGKPLIDKSYGAVGGDMVSQTLKAIEQGTIGRSGSGGGADAVGRYALPKAKPSVVTKQGPRGPINIGQPPAGPPRPAPPKGTRNTSGISDAERAQLPPRPTAPSGTNLEHVPYPKALFESGKNQYGRQSNWYIDPKTNDAYRLVKEGNKEVFEKVSSPALIPSFVYRGKGTKGGGITATKAARETQVEIKKLERWKRSHEAKVRRGDDQYQEGMRSGYEPDIKGGGKMKDNSMKRIQEIQAELDELYKKL